jgi:hypothetical protein
MAARLLRQKDATEGANNTFFALTKQKKKKKKANTTEAQSNASKEVSLLVNVR